jgi:hypothetical protein
LIWQRAILFSGNIFQRFYGWPGPQKLEPQALEKAARPSDFGFEKLPVWVRIGLLAIIPAFILIQIASSGTLVSMPFHVGDKEKSCKEEYA